MTTWPSPSLKFSWESSSSQPPMLYWWQHLWFSWTPILRTGAVSLSLHPFPPFTPNLTDHFLQISLTSLLSFQCPLITLFQNPSSRLLQWSSFDPPTFCIFSESLHRSTPIQPLHYSQNNLSESLLKHLTFLFKNLPSASLLANKFHTS